MAAHHSIAAHCDFPECRLTEKTTLFAVIILVVADCQLMPLAGGLNFV